MSRKSSAARAIRPSRRPPTAPVKNYIASITATIRITLARAASSALRSFYIEQHPKAQLAYSFDIALQNEFSTEENRRLVRQFLLDEFVSRGMIVDYAIHEKDADEDGIQNPHFHVLCPIRPLNPDGGWGNKQRREYILDEHGKRIPNGKGDYEFKAVPTTDWGSPERLEAWRQAWAEL